MNTLRTIWDFRYFWGSLVRMDLRMKYRRSFLGIGWSLMHPIAMTIVFCLIFSSWMEHAQWWQAAPYFLCGLSIWTYLVQSTTQGCHTFFANEYYIRQCPLPLAIYSLRTILGTSIHFCISMSVVIALVCILQESTEPLTVLPAVFPAILLLMILAWSMSVSAAFVNVYFQDMQHLLDVVFQLFFFLTPILYEKKLLYEKGVGFLADFSPVVLFFDLIRTPLLTGEVADFDLYAQACGLVAIGVTVALLLFSKLEKKIIFQL